MSNLWKLQMAHGVLFKDYGHEISKTAVGIWRPIGSTGSWRRSHFLRRRMKSISSNMSSPRSLVNWYITSSCSILRANVHSGPDHQGNPVIDKTLYCPWDAIVLPFRWVVAFSALCNGIPDNFHRIVFLFLNPLAFKVIPAPLQK